MSPAVKRLRTAAWTAAVCLTLFGIASMLTGAFIDGFGGGMLQGAGLTFTVIGVVSMTARAGWLRRSADGGRDDRGWWLPSRDDR
ncbi:hypothetical protein GE115_08735 [Agromyces sp. CFH 90414]|uniref:Uncharacterized protein n=1 Tax=Agromyces agglutinans TaxID=2662258 RepID=A0A6I2FDD2_9MICO|nr:hypothetical protein [Agromyces agglutinans]MRG59953.1 hypothetical protein [Agromyces agglutinans]